MENSKMTYFCVSESDYYEYLCEDKKIISSFLEKKEDYLRKNKGCIDQYEDDYFNVYLGDLTASEKEEYSDYLIRGYYSLLKYRSEEDDENDWKIKVFNTSSPLAMWLCGVEFQDQEEE